MSGPFVSITIPTRNSAAVLRETLQSIKAQSFRDFEVLIIDAFSKDDTAEIAREFGAKTVFFDGGLLGARCLGVEQARGEFILLLDSDQILEGSVLERAVAMMSQYDMLVLEEMSLQPRGFFPLLLAADRKLIHSCICERSFDPIHGTVLPRFFRRDLLIKAIAHIPEKVRSVVVHHDHAILYLECWQLSRKVGVLPKAIYHREPSGPAQLKRAFRYGRSLFHLRNTGYYEELLKHRDRGLRPGTFHPRYLHLGLPSLLLMAFLQGVWSLGYWWEAFHLRRHHFLRPTSAPRPS